MLNKFRFFTLLTFTSVIIESALKQYDTLIVNIQINITEYFWLCIKPHHWNFLQFLKTGY